MTTTAPALSERQQRITDTTLAAVWSRIEDMDEGRAAEVVRIAETFRRDAAVLRAESEALSTDDGMTGAEWGDAYDAVAAALEDVPTHDWHDDDAITCPQCGRRADLDLGPRPLAVCPSKACAYRFLCVWEATAEELAREGCPEDGCDGHLADATLVCDTCGADPHGYYDDDVPGE